MSTFDHFGVDLKTNGDHFGVDLGIISGLGIILGSGSFWGLYSSPHKGSAQRRFAPLQKSR